MPLRRTTQGFTLIESLIALVILALLMSLSGISWSPLIASNRHKDIVNTTHRMFSLARSYAITQKTVTTVCPLSSSLQCIDDWNKPVSIFPDVDNDKRPDDGRIYQVFELADEQSILYSRTAGRGYFQLAPDGMSRGTMGSLVACTSAGDSLLEMSYLALNIGGRLRTLADDDNDGIITLPWGATVTC
jgi:type IV fimbrial biogenesis protein FimT